MQSLASEVPGHRQRQRSVLAGGHDASVQSGWCRSTTTRTASLAGESSSAVTFPTATNWTIEQGSVLDDRYVERLGFFDVVYSWGVLHHTGEAVACARERGQRRWPRAGVCSSRVNRDQGWLSAIYGCRSRSSTTAAPSAAGPCWRRLAARCGCRVSSATSFAAGTRSRAGKRPRTAAAGCRASTTGSTGWAACRSRSRPRRLCSPSTQQRRFRAGEPRPEPRPRLQRIRVLALRGRCRRSRCASRGRRHSCDGAGEGAPAPAARGGDAVCGIAGSRRRRRGRPRSARRAGAGARDDGRASPSRPRRVRCPPERGRRARARAAVDHRSLAPTPISRC